MGLRGRRRLAIEPAPPWDLLRRLPPPYGPDRLVFGPQDTEPGERGPFPSDWCACGCGQADGATCWQCGKGAQG